MMAYDTEYMTRLHCSEDLGERARGCFGLGVVVYNTLLSNGIRSKERATYVPRERVTLRAAIFLINLVRKESWAACEWICSPHLVFCLTLDQMSSE